MYGSFVGCHHNIRVLLVSMGRGQGFFMFCKAAGKFCRGINGSAPNANIVPQRNTRLSEMKYVTLGRTLANDSMHIKGNRCMTLRR